MKLMICPDAENCKTKCRHSKPHEENDYCNGRCGLHKTPACKRIHDAGASTRMVKAHIEQKKMKGAE